MKIYSQPFDGALGNLLKEQLRTEKYHTLNVVVAFAKDSGVRRLKDDLTYFCSKGGRANIYVGIDLDGTSQDALECLFNVGSNLTVVSDVNQNTFHPKVFNFVGEKESLLIVGSHNLTAGGLWTNYETSIHKILDLTDPKEAAVQKSIEDYLEKLEGTKEIIYPISSLEDVEKLVEHGLVKTEFTLKVEHAKKVKKYSTRSENRGKADIFGKGPKTPIPPLGESGGVELDLKTSPTISTDTEIDLDLKHEKENLFLWLETRKMTGGSRNILDLSKMSLIETGSVKGTHFESEDELHMKGAVEFFGIDTENTDQKKDIIINFQGVDYYGNTILFPVGEKSNGTWRVQIKGRSSMGERITERLKSLEKNGYYLQKKIVAFSRIGKDHYQMRVMSENKIDLIINASQVVAYNGLTRSARRLGLV